eukprot:gnl/TRDRNA2_/TRDRNA2_194903_c0_seq1.p1 gnl/TRDRNA2_/TRDRNA2_194903_c0~~gnl/TRDRNA2_/TRDRNA2_194903_c0_seq1.p1  ORF type:complete len:633 (-),score=132.89 gnl/TRDRNA2_/TRDRNA2_194903_c0_seq1:79-1839(-)
MGAVDDEDSEEEIDTVERVKPKELVKRTFADVKRLIKLNDSILREPEDLEFLGKVAAKAQTHIRNGDVNRTERVVSHGMQVASRMSELAASDGSSPGIGPVPPAKYEIPLGSWRPGKVVPSYLPALKLRREAAEKEYKDAVRARDASLGQEAGAEDADGATNVELPKTPGSAEAALLDRKRQADASVKREEYQDALAGYEHCLEEGEKAGIFEAERRFRAAAKSGAGLDQEGRYDPEKLPLEAALLSNIALCLLRLSPLQHPWSRVTSMLQRTVERCDQALMIEFANAKAHYRRGCALEGLERFAEAFESYEKASRFEPADPNIRAAYDRGLSYVEAAIGPEAFDSARQRLEALDPAMKKMRRKPKTLGAEQEKQSGGDAPRLLAAGKKPAEFLLEMCVNCRASTGGEGFMATPCAHGPFCRSCKEHIEGSRRNKDSLLFCPECRRTSGGIASKAGIGIIDGWKLGEEAPIKPKQRAQKFGPRKPRPPVYRQDPSEAAARADKKKTMAKEMPSSQADGTEDSFSEFDFDESAEADDQETDEDMPELVPAMNDLSLSNGTKTVAKEEDNFVHLQRMQGREQGMDLLD